MENLDLIVDIIEDKESDDNIIDIDFELHEEE